MCGFCGWSRFAERIERMLEDRRYRFAWRTLDGIWRGVIGNEHCSHGQREAVGNIEASISRQHPRPHHRRGHAS
jgi:hypothetical protein